MDGPSGTIGGNADGILGVAIFRCVPMTRYTDCLPINVRIRHNRRPLFSVCYCKKKSDCKKPKGRVYENAIVIVKTSRRKSNFCELLYYSDHKLIGFVRCWRVNAAHLYIIFHIIYLYTR